jgi:DNA-binding response OmpR family regulator/predicted nucleic acid-binding protein
MTARNTRGLGDTNILIFLERLPTASLPAELLTSTVSLAELSAGVHSAQDAAECARRVLRLQRVEATFSPLPFDAEAARQYGLIAAEVIAMGRKPPGRMADLMIAGIAAANQLPLYTTNPADFRGLESVVTVVPVPRPERLTAQLPLCNLVRAMMGIMRVLVIEDDSELADAIAAGLRQEQLAVDIAYDGAAGLDRALFTDYDVVVLDRDLPGRHGDDVCAELVKAGCRSRVLMLTAAATIEDRVDGLGLGADDYLPKPFAFAELVARLRALMRRAQPPLAPVLEHNDLRLDPARRTVTRAGRALDLGPKEFGVLELLLAARGRVVSAEELLERVWDEMADPFTSAVKVTMSRLRRKLGDPQVIETMAQAGYRIPA